MATNSIDKRSSYLHWSHCTLDSAGSIAGRVTCHSEVYPLRTDEESSAMVARCCYGAITILHG
eukprot:10414785-Ditylum_brightwellii.AAC.1